MIIILTSIRSITMSFGFLIRWALLGGMILGIVLGRTIEGDHASEGLVVGLQSFVPLIITVGITFIFIRLTHSRLNTKIEASRVLTTVNYIVCWVLLLVGYIYIKIEIFSIAKSVR